MRAVVILINHRCPFKCRHCSLGFSESYSGDERELKPEVLREIISSIDPSIYKQVILAGGEPSLNPELVAVGVDECRKAGLISSMVSAPMWARSARSAEQFLNKVVGLDMLILSYDQFHLEFLTFDHYKNATVKAFEKSISVSIVTVYLNDQDLRQQLESLRPIRHCLTTIGSIPAVSLRNAAALGNTKRKTILIESESDLDKIPRGCSVQNVHVDSDLGLHGCCWSITAERSPFAILPRDGDSLCYRFKRLENIPVFQSLLQNGFLDSLSSDGRKLLVGAVKGERFSSECDICLSTMKKGYEHFWVECVAGSQMGQRKKLNRLKRDCKGYVS